MQDIGELTDAQVEAFRANTAAYEAEREIGMMQDIEVRCVVKVYDKNHFSYQNQEKLIVESCSNNPRQVVLSYIHSDGEVVVQFLVFAADLIDATQRASSSSR